MRAPPTKFPEDARCKNAIKVVPGGAVHSREDAPGFVMAKQRQVAARVKDRAMPGNGPKAQSPGLRVLNFKPHFAGLT